MTRIHFQSIYVNKLADSSGIFKGTNKPMGWKDNVKTNHGVGDSAGDNNTVIGGVLIIHDEDTIDQLNINNKG